MSKYKMTDRWVNSFRPDDGARAEVGDLLCPGLYLRASVAGAKSWSAVIRTGDRVQRITLGRYPVMTLAAARDETLRLLREVASGAAIGRDAEPRPPALLDQRTLGELIDAYVEHIRKNARSWALIAASLRRPEMQPLHCRPAIGITKGELVAVVDGLAVAAPHAGVSLLKHLKMAINFAVERDMLPANPLDKVRPPAKTTERERVLKDAEIVAVLGACDKVPAPFGAMVRMLLYTGARRNEIAHMRWSELNDNVWTLPAARSKSNRANSLPLAPAAMSVLASLPHYGDDAFVFTTTAGKSPSSDFSKRKRLLDAASGVTGWHLHDLRRTCRTKLSELGIPREVARRIIGHSVDKLDSVYDRHSFMEQKGSGLLLLAEHLDGLLRITAALTIEPAVPI